MSHGNEEGNLCNRPVYVDGHLAGSCSGHLQYVREGDCSCHISPPCSACTSMPLVCDECGFEVPYVEPKVTSGPLFPPEWFKPYSDVYNDKITEAKAGTLVKAWHYRASHSSCSMRCIGIAPLGTSRETVLPEVDGTFGGRWVKWDQRATHIEFEYMAYTD